MNAIIHKTRVALIKLGKVLPFIVCGLAFISYLESAFALYNQDFLLYDDYVLLQKPISYFIGSYFEYNIQMLVVLCIISIAIETCIYNKLACGYLGINLWEKSYLDFELEPTYIYIICLANILVAWYLTIRGISILTRKQL